MSRLHQRTIFFAAGLAVSAGSIWPLYIGAQAASPVEARCPQAFPDEEDPWDAIREILEIICLLIPCAGGQTPQAMPSDMRARITHVVDTYETFGIHPNLTETERKAGLVACHSAQKWVEAYPGWIDAPHLEAEFMRTLESMIRDLTSEAHTSMASSP